MRICREGGISLLAREVESFPSASLFSDLQKRVLDAKAFDVLPVLQVFGQETVDPAFERGLQDLGVPKRERHASVQLDGGEYHRLVYAHQR